MFDFLNNPLPNVFSRGIGELIRQAREAQGLSQVELAQLIKKRRPSLSDMENGKMIPSFETMLYLSIYLQKPLIYFVPEKYRASLKEQEANTELEKEVLIQLRRMSAEKQRIALSQLKALADIDT